MPHCLPFLPVLVSRRPFYIYSNSFTGVPVTIQLAVVQRGTIKRRGSRARVRVLFLRLSVSCALFLSAIAFEPRLALDLFNRVRVYRPILKKGVHISTGK